MRKKSVETDFFCWMWSCDHEQKCRPDKLYKLAIKRNTTPFNAVKTHIISHEKQQRQTQNDNIDR